jgi:hypothetical protein
MIFLFVLPLVAEMTGACHCTQPLIEMQGGGVSPTFCLDWSGTTVLLVSSSKVARIASLNYRAGFTLNSDVEITGRRRK